MKKMKRFLSVSLVLAMLIGMLVLPVSAATYDYTLTENVPQEYTLKYNETAYFHFEVEETGWYLICGPESGMSFGWALYEAPEEDYSKYIEIEFWFDPTETYFGTAVYAEAGKVYTCKNESDSTSAVTNTLTLMKAEQYETFTLSKTEASGAVGEDLMLSIDVGPQFAYEPITWTSTDPAVATRRGNTMDTVGDIALLAPGTATITATTESGWSASCVVTVEGEAVESGPLDFTLTENVPQEYTLKYNETAYFHFEVEETGWYLLCGPESGTSFGWAMYEAPEEDYSKYIEIEFWFDPTETYFGTAVYAEAGKVYTCKNESDSTSAVTNTLTLMKAEQYETFTLSKTEATGAVGEDLRLSIDVGPQFAYEPITWTISDPTVAIRRENTMDTAGDIALLAPGTATITATTESGWSASCVVTVEGESAETDLETITPGETKSFTLAANQLKFFNFVPAESGRYIVYVPANTCYLGVAVGDDYLTGSEVPADSWESDDNCYLGMVFEAEAGKNYVIKAGNDLPSVDMDCQLTLIEAVNYETLSFDLNQYVAYFDSMNCSPQNLMTVIASGTPAAAHEKLEWTTSDPSVLAIEYTHGNEATFYIAGVGTATVTATAASGISASCNVTVKLPAEPALNEPETITISNYGFGLALFTPTADGSYSISYESTTGKDAAVTVWDLDMNCLTPASENEYLLNAGVTYTIRIDNHVAAVNNGKLLIQGMERINVGETKNVTLELDTWKSFSFTPAEDGKYLLYGPKDTSIHMDAYSAKDYEDCESFQWQNPDAGYSGYVFNMTGGTEYVVSAINWGINTSLETTLTMIKAEAFESISLTKSSHEGYSDSYLQLYWSAAPEFAVGEVTWSSSDPEVADIFMATGNNAEVYLKSGGVATITATTDNGRSASCVVTVHQRIGETLRLNETREFELPGNGQESDFYFTAPEDGTYSFYIERNGQIGTSTHDVDTNKQVYSNSWFRNEFYVSDYEMTAGQTLKFGVYNYEEKDVKFRIGIGQEGKAESLILSDTEYVAATGGLARLSHTFTPFLAIEEEITWSSTDDMIAFYQTTVSEENYVCHIFSCWAKGTATITATSESGLTASCKVIVMDPKTVQPGVHETETLAAGEICLYAFTPQKAGKYVVYDEFADSEIVMRGANSDKLGETWKSGKKDGKVAQLEAGEVMWITIKNTSDAAQTFTLHLEEGVHEHALTLVPEKAPTFTEDGMKAHYACECGVLFADEAGTTIVEAADLLIPKLIQVEDGKAEIDKEAIDNAVAEVEQGGEVSIPVADAGAGSEEEVKSAALPVESLTQITEKEATLTVEMPAATVTMDTAALAAVVEKAGENASVTLEVVEVPEEDLTETQMAAIKKLDQNLVTAISAELLVNGENIATEADDGFGGGKVTVKIPVKLSSKDFQVVYIADDGSTTVIENATYADGVLTMELEHFSTYAIVQDSMLGDTDGNGKIQTNDAKLILQHIVRMPVELNLDAADVDGNGKIQTNDAKLILQYIVKIITKFPTQA